ncbi:uncharacterized protein LOC115455319 [Manduca sexta]|uniref:uncharacterized protein LOC115455319 n=1 Tax=Manduca sexta TaxID=7130 RepID=UPI00188DF813|nr:uncharacterized protein LOC115455319 [Manduca sexta]
MRDHRGVRIFQGINGNGAVVKSAIAVFNDGWTATPCPALTTTNITVVKIQTGARDLILISFYFEPDKPIGPYLEQLGKAVETLGRNGILIGGDTNAKSIWWGSAETDSRGEEMAGMLGEWGLQVLNDGGSPTFETVRGGKLLTSHIDITACSEDIVDKINDWRVDDTMASSDHNAITLKIRKSKDNNVKRKHKTTRKYNTRKANWTYFNEKLKELINLPWWSDELAKMKREVNTKRRRIRCAAPIRRAKVVDEYLKSKEEYENEAKKAQIDSWKEFCRKQNRETIWEGVYRIIGKACPMKEDLPLIHQGQTLTEIESAKLLAETFYPEDNPETDNAEHQRIRSAATKVNDRVYDEPHDPPFTIEELHLAANSFNPKKAPGSDGLTADICKQAIAASPGLYLSLANKCLELGHFPTIWKEATVIVLRKPAKEDYTNAKSYRPIGLLPVMEGAFDSAWWPAIRVRLAEEGCPANIRRVVDSYLQSRKVKVRYSGEEVERWTSKGCVQGSIGGPTFWNLLLDPLLFELDRRGSHCQAFADDVVLAFEGQEMGEIQKRANETLAYVKDWGIRNKLKFAPHKTKAMVITRKLKYDSPILHMGGVDIGLEKQIKILGVTIDSGLTFNTHVSEVCRKAVAFYNKLSRAARLQWGLGPDVIKLLYTAVVEPVVLYGASVWAPASRKLGVRKQLAVVQRGFAQKLTKAYRTVSLNSALLLAGILPLDIRARENASLYEIKRGYSRRVVGDREVERPVAYGELEHPAQRSMVRYRCLADGAEVNQITSQCLCIYTDGSKIQDKVGAAISIWENAAETRSKKFKMESFCTVYQAELLALHGATEEAVKSGREICSVLSDSRAALDTVADGTSLHPLAFKIRKNLRTLKERNKIINLFWIKAHAGMEGNERADELAKDAALKSKTKPQYSRCPVSYVKRQIRAESVDEWDRRYTEGETASTTKIFFPNVVEAHRIMKQTPIDPILTQVFTGHGGFSEYLHRFKCKESPACICDPTESECVMHVLTKCPVHLRERTELEIELDIEVKIENIHIIIAEKKVEINS